MSFKNILGTHHISQLINMVCNETIVKIIFVKIIKVMPFYFLVTEKY